MLLTDGRTLIEVPRPAERRVGAAQVAPAQVPGLSGLLGLAIGVVVIAGLYFAKDILIPVTLAILLSFVLSPIVALLRRWRLPKAPAVLVSVVFALGLLGGVGTLVGMQAASLSGNAPGYARTIEGKIDSAKGFTARKLAFFNKSVSSKSPHAAPDAVPSLVERTLSGGGREPVPVRVTGNEPTALSMVSSVLAPVLAPFETFFIVLVVAIFILMQKEDLRDRVIRVFGSSDLHRTTLAMDDAGARLSRYFLSQLAVNTCFGVVIGLGMWAIGMPVPALWGILAGVLRFVPYVGALLGAALPLAIASGIDPGWAMPIEVIALFAIVEPLTGYAIEPMLYGHSTGLSPLSVILAAVFWTWIWGPVGLVLSMPLTLCLTVLGRHVPSMEFIDVLLGDRPALTPVEGFYQRMLADDPDEALEQADLLIPECGLTRYYDEVALGGLKLAAADAGRGAIDHDGARRITDTMLALIGELDDRDEDEADASPQAPAGWSEPGAVACVAGRGVLDDAVTAILAQLLARRGFGTRRVAATAVSRGALDQLELPGVRLICLSYLELGGTPSKLRYLVQRLRRRFPEASILVGLWPEGEAALSDAQIQHTLGADLYVPTLGAAVDAVLALANRPVVEAAA